MGFSRFMTQLSEAEYDQTLFQEDLKQPGKQSPGAEEGKNRGECRRNHILRRLPREPWADGRGPGNPSTGLSDPEAKVGRGKRGEYFLGYKSHWGGDWCSEIPVAYAVTTAREK